MSLRSSRLLAEQEVVAGRIEAAVPERVAGQVHDAQAAPERRLVVVADRYVDRGGPADAQQGAAGALQPSAPDVGPGKKIAAKLRFAMTMAASPSV